MSEHAWAQDQSPAERQQAAKIEALEQQVKAHYELLVTTIDRMIKAEAQSARLHNALDDLCNDAWLRHRDRNPAEFRQALAYERCANDVRRLLIHPDLGEMPDKGRLERLRDTWKPGDRITVPRIGSHYSDPDRRQPGVVVKVEPEVRIDGNVIVHLDGETEFKSINPGVLLGED